MKQVEGFLNELDVNEYSKTLGINETIEHIGKHVAWICPACEEVNAEFDIKHSPMKCSCDKCKTKFWVLYKNQIIKKGADLSQLLDAKVVEE